MLNAGEVAEWSNVPDSKSGVVATSPWVRIPPSPPVFLASLFYGAIFLLSSLGEDRVGGWVPHAGVPEIVTHPPTPSSPSCEQQFWWSDISRVPQVE